MPDNLVFAFEFIGEAMDHASSFRRIGLYGVYVVDCGFCTVETCEEVDGLEVPVGADVIVDFET